LCFYRYAKGCTVVAEFGVRSVVSTWAFLRGLRDTDGINKKLISVDLERSENIVPAQIAAAQNSITPTHCLIAILFTLDRLIFTISRDNIGVYTSK
jgi:hypothetical protein